MKKKMFVVSIISLALMFVFFGVFLGTDNLTYLGIGVLCFSVCYQVTLRLAPTAVVDYNLKNTVDLGKKWFQPLSFEKNFYKNIRLKRWKDIFPTADPDAYSIKKRTREQIAMACCQTEIIHEICFILGFASLFFSIPFGYLPAFLITSALAALIDLAYIMIQRLNRPRLLKK